jgi:transposase
MSKLYHKYPHFRRFLTDISYYSIIDMIKYKFS